jgi:hypothetical protein
MDKGGFTNFDCNFFLLVLMAGDKKPPLNICMYNYIYTAVLPLCVVYIPPPPIPTTLAARRVPLASQIITLGICSLFSHFQKSQL